MSEALIAKLIETRLQRWADLEDLQIAFENVTFDPPKDAVYAEVFHFPSTTTGGFLEGGHKSFTGFYQVSLVCPKGRGAGPGRTFGVSLSNYMPQNLILAEGDFRVQISQPVSIARGVPDAEGAKRARFTIPCRFSYRADTTT